MFPRGFLDAIRLHSSFFFSFSLFFFSLLLPLRRAVSAFFPFSPILTTLLLCPRLGDLFFPLLFLNFPLPPLPAPLAERGHPELQLKRLENGKEGVKPPFLLFLGTTFSLPSLWATAAVTQHCGQESNRKMFMDILLFLLPFFAVFFVVPSAAQAKAAVARCCGSWSVYRSSPPSSSDFPSRHNDRSRFSRPKNYFHRTEGARFRHRFFFFFLSPPFSYFI